MSRILVLGAYGLVGASLCPRLIDGGHVVVRQGRRDGAELRLDPGDAGQLGDALDRLQPQVVVNLVAATDVDACEADPQLAYLGNVRPVEALVETLGRRPAAAPHLLQVSTDQVYDGPGPHRERDARPCNVYALSKLAGELAATQVAATVLRTNLFGRSRAGGRLSLSDWIVGSLQAGRPITVFNDVLFSALHLDTLCDVIARAIELRPPGTFNAGCRDGISKAAFAHALAERLGLDRSLMTTGPSRAAGLRARRPLDMRMEVSAFEAAFDSAAPTIDSQIHLAASEVSTCSNPSANS